MSTTPPDKRRRKATIRKNIRLSPDTIEDVTAWCQSNGASFSAGAETLLLMSLGKPAAEYVVPAIVSATRRAILHQFNRLSKLWSFAAVESGVAARLAGLSAQLAIRRLVFDESFGFMDDPDLTAEQIVFSHDSDLRVGEEEEALTLYRDARAKARTQALRDIKIPMELLLNHLQDTRREDD